MDFAKRAARNEEAVREVNRQIEEGARLHEVTSPMPIHCECARQACFEKLELDAATYERTLAERYRFVVAPSHVAPAIERVVEENDGYVIVEKVGEAREEIERQHPQERHRA